MQIKQQALSQYLNKKQPTFYMLIGQDNYLIDEAARSIKTAIKARFDYEEKTLSVENTQDWNTLIEEANSYSLFSDTTLINVYFDKKSIDAAAKKILTEYLNTVNPRCFIIIRAPNIPAKQLPWLTALEQALVVVAYSLNNEAMKQWIVSQFRANSLSFDAPIPELILQYTQGNMLACAQVIEKLALTHPANSQINKQQTLEHLSNQCEHSLYELVELCLLGHANKAIQILRQAAESKTEATLVLWMLTQEVRLLVQLKFLQEQGIDFNTACGQLKIWAQRTPLYQASLKRAHKETLIELLHYCKVIDERIKSSLNTQVWNSLENLILSLSLGKPVGELCAI